MKKLKQTIAGFVVFNFLAIAVFAACAGSITINGASCSLNNEWNGYCWYECPNGDVVARPKGNGEEIEQTNQN